MTGILPLCVNEDGLATVLGHEIAHNVAQHAAERMSQLSILWVVAVAVASVFDISGGLPSLVLDLVFQRPGSRKQESEADHIGLLMMAQSCFDVNEALRLFVDPRYSIIAIFKLMPAAGNAWTQVRRTSRHNFCPLILRYCSSYGNVRVQALLNSSRNIIGSKSSKNGKVFPMSADGLLLIASGYLRHENGVRRVAVE